MTEPFYFSEGRLAYNVADLLELCQQDPDAGTGYLVKQDLENWLAYIGSYDVAECATNARQAALGDRQKLEEFLNKSHSVIQEKAVPAAVTETPSSQAATTVESVVGTEEQSVSDPSTSSSQATEADIDESKQLAAVESTLIENSEESPETPSTPTRATEAAVEESKVLAQAESKLANERGSATPPTSTTKTSEPINEEKPSFFQIIARFIVKILYRNKA